MCRVRQALGEALTAEDDAAVLQELEELEDLEAKEEAGQLPSVPKVPALPGSCACACFLPSMLGVHSDP